jgi:hypothetical protein
MADFCLDCARRLGLPEPDIKADPGSTTWDVCEGCGPRWFDEHGKRVKDVGHFSRKLLAHEESSRKNSCLRLCFF